jgi:uncharacterized protein (UPF0332 family)
VKEEIKELVLDRLNRAKRALADASILLGAQSYFGAVNRIYYASFYAAKALLILKELDAPKHSGVIALFNQHFVKEGIIAKETGRILNDLFGLRIEGDYEDFKTFKREEAEEALHKCQFFIAEIENVIRSKVAE